MAGYQTRGRKINKIHNSPGGPCFPVFLWCAAQKVVNGSIETGKEGRDDGVMNLEGALVSVVW